MFTYRETFIPAEYLPDTFILTYNLDKVEK